MPEKPPYRVCVLGCGAIGTQLAARLTLGGKASVIALARGATVAALREGGVMRTKEGVKHFKLEGACDTPEGVGRVDAVIVAVKATQLQSVAATLGKLVEGTAEDFPVFFAINGIPWYYFHGCGGSREGQQLPLVDPGGMLWSSVGPKRAVHIVCKTASSITQPGEVQVNSPRNIFDILEPSGTTSSPRAHRLSEALAAGGVEAPVGADMRYEIWWKLSGNMAINPISVLTGGTIAGMALDTDLRDRALKPLIVEGTAVASALGVDTSKFPTPDARIDVIRLNTHPTSMLQDFRAGRELETNALLEQVQVFARELGVKTPMLDVVLTLVKSAERFSPKRSLDGAGEEGKAKRLQAES